MKNIYIFAVPKQMVNVAQLVRALVCGTRGRGFEPHLSPFREDDQYFRLSSFLLSVLFFIFVPTKTFIRTECLRCGKLNSNMK